MKHAYTKSIHYLKFDQFIKCKYVPNNAGDVLIFKKKKVIYLKVTYNSNLIGILDFIWQPYLRALSPLSHHVQETRKDGVEPSDLLHPTPPHSQHCESSLSCF